MFEFFKKKDKESIKELTLNNLTIGASLEYDMKSWIVEEVYNYLWENEGKSIEYKLNNGNEVVFLEIDDEETIYITTPKNIQNVITNFKKEVISNSSVPENIIYNNEVYKLDKEEFGEFQKQGEDGWSEFTTWTYWNDKEQFLCIERWSKFEFETHLGKKINPFEIDNLLPGK